MQRALRLVDGERQLHARQPALRLEAQEGETDVLKEQAIVLLAAKRLVLKDRLTRLEAAGLKAEVAEVTMKPVTETVFTGEDAARMQKLLDVLEGLDDVQQVYTNAVIDEAAL